MDSARAVFVARVTGHRSLAAFGSGNGFVNGYDLEVIESWKGMASRTAYIVSGDGGGDCSMPLDVGETYVIYGHSNGSEPLSSYLCSRTRPLVDAADDIRYLRTLPTLPLAPASAVPMWAIVLGGLAAVGVLAYGYGVEARWRRGEGAG
ncbi:MAG: hypothetical protein IPG72_11130 [Ardenticatenales bacterium]|jgi:hypothetical protein|nr:hypothetical protein [Ardenticatenales bacterium]